jgi:UMF1 family MFS transporter
MDETKTPTPSVKTFAAWCLFDWANSAYFTNITTFIFATYFTQAVAADPTLGTAQWGQTSSLAGLAIALTAPVLGAIADHGGRRKPWIVGWSLVCIAATALLWFVRPNVADVPMALALVALATVGAEFAVVFYNATLPGLVGPDRVGRLSGWGWGVGYVGGLVCLTLALVGFVQPETPWFGLDKTALEHIRAVGPLTALWYLAFMLPFAFLVPEIRGPGLAAAAAIRAGLKQLKASWGEAKRQPDLIRFLAANMLYTNGLTTLFAFGGIYAAGSFGFSTAEVIQFGILLNVTAALGAAGFGWLDDRIGPRPVILIALGGLTLCGAAVLIVHDKLWFWIVGTLLGIFVGPAQAASRTLMAKLAPADKRNEMFGLFALSGKATAFAGPAVLGWITLAFDSQRAGMTTILVFFVLGFVLLWGVASRR